MFKRIWEKLKIKPKVKKEEYPNRFLKFYHLNKKRLIKERRKNYSQKQKSGICVRCQKPVVPGIIFCEYHQQKQKEYNRQAREKKSS